MAFGDTVNALIPLQAGRGVPPVGISPAEQNQMLMTQLRLAQVKQTQDAQNALKGLFSNPANLDASGMPSPNALRTLMQASPETGLETMNTLAKLQEQRARTTFTQSKISDAVQEQVYQIGKESRAAYWDALKTMPPDAALKVGQEKYTEKLDAFKATGLASPDIVARLAPNFDPERVTRNVNAYEQAHADPAKQNQFEVRTDAGKTPHVDYRLYADGRTTDLQGNPYTPTGIAAEKGPEATIFVGKTPDGKEVRFRYGPTGTINPDTNEPVDASKLKGIGRLGTERQLSPQAQALQKFQEENPTATADDYIKFLQKNRPARSGPAMIIQKWLDEHPNATAEETAQFSGKLRERSAAQQAFATGTQGNTVRSLNVAVDHMGVAQELGEALKNNDVNALNRMTNLFKTEFGHGGPPSFDFAKKIVGDEIAKAVLGTGAGTGEERKALQADFDRARSPEQLQGVIHTAKRLMLGQLRGLEKQFTDSTGLDEGEFRQKLFPRTIKELEGSDTGGAPTGVPTISSKEQKDALPPGARYRLPDDPSGATRTKQ